MVEPSNPLDQARALTAGIARRHRVELPRDFRRRAIPSRSAKTRDVSISVAPGGIWLDINGRAGVLFGADEWAQLVLEGVALLLEVSDQWPGTADPTQPVEP